MNRCRLIGGPFDGHEQLTIQQGDLRLPTVDCTAESRADRSAKILAAFASGQYARYRPMDIIDLDGCRLYGYSGSGLAAGGDPGMRRLADTVEEREKRSQEDE